LAAKTDEINIWEKVLASIRDLDGVSAVKLDHATMRVGDLQVIVLTTGRDRARRLHDDIMRKLTRNRSVSILGIEYDLKKMSGNE
jgi:uncharacterized protein